MILWWWEGSQTPEFITISWRLICPSLGWTQMNQHSWNIFKRTTPTPEWFVHEFHFYLPAGPKKLGLDWPWSVHNTTWIELSWATKKRNSDTFHEIHVSLIFRNPYFMVYDEIIHTNNITASGFRSLPFFQPFRVHLLTSIAQKLGEGLPMTEI